jgi:hypothetical protein
MRVSVVVAALVILIWASVTGAEIPRKFNYQGRLTDSATGDPLAGPQDVTFRIYDQASNGSLLWSEEQTLLPDATGVVAAILGSVDLIDVEFDGSIWLEVEVAGEILMPRREIVSVPFALRAGSADEADSAAHATSADHATTSDTATSATHAVTADTAGVATHATSSDSLAGYAAADFADTAHVHDERYYTQDSLTVPGTLNDTANPVDWSKLKNVPAGFADGTDDGGGGTGDGHSLDSDSGVHTDVVYVDNYANVGVGTTGPQGKLHVYADRDAQAAIVIENPNTGSGSAERISFKDESGSVAGIMTYDPDNVTYPDGMRLFNNRSEGFIGFQVTGGDDLMRLTGNNVGIGTTTPGERLDVAGTTRMTGFKMPTGAADGYVLTSNATGTGTWQPGAVGDGHSLDAVDGSPVDALYVDLRGDVGIGTTDASTKLHVYEDTNGQATITIENPNTGSLSGERISFNDENGGVAAIITYDPESLSFPNGMRIFNNRPGGGIGLRINGTSDLVRLKGDNVGIGTTTPGERLDVAGTARMAGFKMPTGAVDGYVLESDATGIGSWQPAATGDGHSLDAADGSPIDALYVDNDGHVGIGTSSPEHQLHINEPAGGFCYGLMTSSSTGSTYDDGLVFGVDNPGKAFLVNQEDGPLYLGAGDFYRLTILGDGKVGLGTTVPQRNLHVHDMSAVQCYAQFTNGVTGSGENDGLFVGLDQSGAGRLWQNENLPLFIGTNNTNAMSIKANGDVGLGFLLPEVKLAVEGVVRVEGDDWPTAGEGMELAYNSTFDRGYIQVYDRNGLGSWGELYLGSGNVGIGKADPATLLHLAGANPYVTVSTTANDVGLRLAKNDATRWEMAYNEGSGYLYLWGSGGAGTSMVIENATGDVGIGTSSPSYPLDVAGAAHASSHPTSSDERFKRDVRPLSGVLDKLGRIRGVSFEWNGLYESLGRASGYREIGVIAQEVEAEFPELVTTWGEDDYRAVEYGRMTGVLIEAIKELRAENEALRQRVEALEGATN